MDYKKILKKIKKWKGVDEEYWKAVEILKKYNQVNEKEINRLNQGLDCRTEGYVITKMIKLKKNCINEIDRIKNLPISCQS